MTDAKTLLRCFRVGADNSNVYLLGSFAKRVTLYSQQVRALNLISALLKLNRLRPGQELAIVGAGAAGLTAAAAAAQKGLKVSVFERLSGPMEFQSNNRQRWLHPHLYEWPNDEYEDTDHAYLPILTWRSDYAAGVVSQLLKSWRRSQKTFQIDTHYSVEGLSFIRLGEKIEISSDKFRRMTFDGVILAIGFGLEASSEAHQWSYWEEDDVDGNFQSIRTRKRWLIAGAGDGGLTDLMRLCLRRFRHSMVLSQFEGISALVELKKRLRTINAMSDPNEIHQAFLKIDDITLGALAARLKPSIRSDVHVTIAVGSEAQLYGPKSSTLNRLIVRVLQKLNMFTEIKYKVDIVHKDNLFRANWGQGDHHFERAIQRFGPKSETQDPLWRDFRDDLNLLKNQWDTLNEGANDFTKKRLWRPGFYDQDLSTGSFCSHSGPANAQGVVADTLEIDKISEAGEAFNTYQYRLTGLRVTEGSVAGIWLHFNTTGGDIGDVVLGEYKGVGSVSWERRVSQPSDNIEHQLVNLERHYKRTRCGIIWFDAPLTITSEPVNISWKVYGSDSDALTAWESEQLYGKNHIQRPDSNEAREPVEFLARVVWFPINTLVIRVSMPSLGCGDPYEKTYCWYGVSPENESDHEPRILYMNPKTDNVGRWVSVTPSGNAEVELDAEGSIDSNRINVWKLRISQPRIGYCYTLEWRVPSISIPDRVASTEESVKKLRAQLWTVRERLKSARNEDISRIQTEFGEFSREISSCFSTSEQHFDLSLASYRTTDSQWGEIFFVGSVSKGVFSDGLIDTRFPFGAGVAGRCFRGGKEAVFYSKAHEAEFPAKPQCYLKLSEPAHEEMIAVPIYAELGEQDALPDGFEWPRVCLAVVSLGFFVKPEGEPDDNTRRSRITTALLRISKGFVEKVLQI
jgi:hypothetical protein